MANKNLLDTSTANFSDIIGNAKTYSVPPYQRDYSWKNDRWEDLWSDIIELEQNNEIHYMGSIVLQNKGNKHFHIIDGQQRLATLTIIVLAIIQKLSNLIENGIDSEKNKERIQLLQKKFIGDKDPASLTYSSKLKLNENNDSFFQTKLLIFKKPPTSNILEDSNKILLEAFNYFSDKVNSKFENVDDGAAIVTFLNDVIAEKLMFIQIIVQNELNAYTVFETLNSRFTELTVTDLLKNYFFSIATTDDLPHIKFQWKRIVDSIGLEEFPVFLRHYWISKNTLVRREYLFKAIKNTIKNSSDVIEILDSLESNANLYNALSNYADTFWQGNKDIRKRVKELNLFKERQAYPILIAGYNHLSTVDFVKLLKIISIITFRYTVIGKFHTNKKEEIYNKAAIKISKGELKTIFEIAKTLKDIYPSDKDFINLFSTKSLKTKISKKLVRYILFKIENHLSQNDYDYEENPGTIEHILPENEYQNYIDEFPGSVYETFVNRLGNYTILEDEKNKSCSQLPFDDKKLIYQTSQYHLTKMININSWTPNTLERRQEEMAQWAGSIWRVSQFD
jgi:uncharacterized protein with ParB-like and HNH nuclease domain